MMNRVEKREGSKEMEYWSYWGGGSSVGEEGGRVVR